MRFLLACLACGALLGALWLLGLFDATDGARGVMDAPGELLEAPGLAGRAGPEQADTLDGAALARELEALAGDALIERLGAVLEAEDGGARVGYDEALVLRLIALLSHEEDLVRTGAVALLAAIGPAAASHVEPMLSASNPVWRLLGVRIVTPWFRDGFALPVETWQRLLADPDKRVHRFAWQALCQGVPYDERLAALLEGMIEPQPDPLILGPVRALVAMGLPGVQRLLAALERPGSDLDLTILSGLAWARPGDLGAVLDRLTPWIRAAHEARQIRALRALWNLSAEDRQRALPAVVAAYGHESFPVRLAVLEFLTRHADTAAQAPGLLLQAMRERDERLSLRAIRLLGQLRAEPGIVIPFLRDLLDEGGDDTAAFALGRYGALATEHVRSALASPDDDVRYFGLHAAYAMGPASRSVRAAVRPLVEVDDEDLAKRAAMAMGMMGAEGAEALPAIWALYGAGTLGIDQAAEILARVGSAGQAFLLARLREKASHEPACVVLESWPGDTRFAFDVVLPWLRSERARDRGRALRIVTRALTLPPGPPEGWSRPEDYRPPAGVIPAVRGIVTPYLEDPDLRVRGQVQRALQWIAGYEAVQNG